MLDFGMYLGEGAFVSFGGGTGKYRSFEVQIFGGMGLVDELPIERFWRRRPGRGIWTAPPRSSATSSRGRSWRPHEG